MEIVNSSLPYLYFKCEFNIFNCSESCYLFFTKRKNFKPNAGNNSKVAFNYNCSFSGGLFPDECTS